MYIFDKLVLYIFLFYWVLLFLLFQFPGRLHEQLRAQEEKLRELQLERARRQEGERQQRETEGRGSVLKSRFGFG